MITIKTQDDFELMAAAGKVVAEALAEVRAAAKPGVTTAELDELAEKIIRDRGCVPSFLGYHGFPASICASPNEVVVHGIPGPYTIGEGDLLSIDIGAVYRGWHADAAVTFPIGAVPDDEARLLEVAEVALWEAIEMCTPGRRLGDVGHRVEQVGEDAGYGVVRDYIGHGIGRAMHEPPQVPNYGTQGSGMKLKAGMAICIEPMFNLGTHEVAVLDDAWTVVTLDGRRSAHFEHTVAITDEGPWVLTEV